MIHFFFQAEKKKTRTLFKTKHFEKKEAIKQCVYGEREFVVKCTEDNKRCFLQSVCYLGGG